MLKLRNLIFLAVLFVLVGGYFFAQYKVEQVAKKQIDQIVASAQPMVDMQYEDLSVNLFTRVTTLKNVNFSFPTFPAQTPIKVASLTGKMEVNKDNILTYLNIKADKLQTPVDTTGMNSASLAFFKQLNSTTLVSNLKLKYTHDLKTKDVDVKYDHQVENLGNIKLNMGLGNMPLEAATYEDLNPILVRNFALTYTDNSLVPRLLTSFAEQQGISKETLIAQIIQDINANVVAQQNQQMKGVMLEWEKFLKDPKQFSVKMNPPTPVSLGTLQTLAPDQLAQQLKLDIKAE